MILDLLIFVSDFHFNLKKKKLFCDFITFYINWLLLKDYLKLFVFFPSGHIKKKIK